MLVVETSSFEAAGGRTIIRIYQVILNGGSIVVLVGVRGLVVRTTSGRHHGGHCMQSRSREYWFE